jgi:hypothetical protein
MLRARFVKFMWLGEALKKKKEYIQMAPDFSQTKDNGSSYLYSGTSRLALKIHTYFP